MVDDQCEVPGLSFLLIRELQIQKYSLLILHLYSHPFITQVPDLNDRCQFQGPFRAMAGKEGESIIHELAPGRFIIDLVKVVVLDE